MSFVSFVVPLSYVFCVFCGFPLLRLLCLLWFKMSFVVNTRKKSQKFAPDMTISLFRPAKRHLTIWLLSALFFACGKDKESIVQERVGERVSAFKKKKLLECQETLLQTAESMVDSMLLAMAQSELRDSLARSRPNRPLQPPAIPPIDSLDVRPIFDSVRLMPKIGDR